MCFVLFRLLCGQRIRLTSLFCLSLAQIPWCLHNQPQRKKTSSFLKHTLGFYCRIFAYIFQMNFVLLGVFLAFFFFQAKTNLHIPIARRMRARPFQPEGSFTITLLVETYWFWFAYAMSRWIEQRRRRSKKNTHTRETKSCERASSHCKYDICFYSPWKVLGLVCVIYCMEVRSVFANCFSLWLLLLLLLVSLFISVSIFCIICCWFYNFITHDCVRESECGEAALRPNT